MMLQQSCAGDTAATNQAETQNASPIRVTVGHVCAEVAPSSYGLCMSEPASRLDIEITDGGLSVTGEIDAHTCDELSTALEPLPGSGDVRIDMEGVQFMDSSGLRVLIGAHQRADADGRKLLIERPSKSVFRIIEISGLSDHLHIVKPN